MLVLPDPVGPWGRMLRPIWPRLINPDRQATALSCSNTSLNFLGRYLSARFTSGIVIPNSTVFDEILQCVPATVGACGADEAAVTHHIGADPSVVCAGCFQG